MNRIIKFRAWKENKMIDLEKITPLALAIDEKGIFVPFRNDINLMQFTGLFDKNGVEIWEDDIVMGMFEKMLPARVVFHHGAFRLKRPDRGNMKYLGNKVKLTEVLHCAELMDDWLKSRIKGEIKTRESKELLDNLPF